jgi:urocanate hydratase
MDQISAKGRPQARSLRAPRGAELSCRGWSQEAALRMLMNSLDPEVAERPLDVIVSGAGSAARDGATFDVIARSLRELGNDETLLVESGTPAGIFRTHAWAPRVLIASGDGMERALPASCAEAAAAGWVYVGTQEFLQGVYETLAAAARKHFGGDLAGKLIVTGGMGKTGGALAPAATMNGAAILGIEADPERIKRWLKNGYCDVMVNSLDEALRILKNAVRKREAASVGLSGNCADVIPELARRGVVPDLLTDLTGADDPLNGYLPSRLTMEEAMELRRRDPAEYRKRAMESIARQVEGMLALVKLGSVAFEYGNGIRRMAYEAGVKNAYDFPSFLEAYIQPTLREGRGPVRFVALSGEAADTRRIDRLALDMFGENDVHLARWIRLAQRRVRFQGLPARVCSLGCEERKAFGVAVNDLVASGELKAPVAIASEDAGVGLAQLPNPENAALRDGSDAVADWPLMNALLKAACGASWAWLRKPRNGGADERVHAGLAVAADGTEEMRARIERVFASDTGITPGFEAGYTEAIEATRCSRVRVPMDEAGKS